jgi:hypothetical protein
MNGRIRSPRYPSTPLSEAIERIRKLHQAERKNPVDREVAAKALGYSGISGISATVLSNLIQYGLLEKAGKNEVRVTDRAVEILYPHSDEEKAKALQEAAQEPELFQGIMKKFIDGVPSNNALEAFLVREGYTDTAIQPAIRAFRETFLFLENAIERGRNSQLEADVIESQPEQQVDKLQSMARPMQTQMAAAKPDRGLENRPDRDAPPEGASINFHNRNIILIGGRISTRSQAKELISAITALMPLLKENSEEPGIEAAADSDANEGR